MVGADQHSAWGTGSLHFFPGTFSGAGRLKISWEELSALPF